MVNSENLDPKDALKTEMAIMGTLETAMAGKKIQDVVSIDQYEKEKSFQLKAKYFNEWCKRTSVVLKKQKYFQDGMVLKNVKIPQSVTSSWLKKVMFNPSSRMARQVACNMIESFCVKSGVSETLGGDGENFERKKYVLDLLTTFLDELGGAGEASSEYVVLYQRLIGGSGGGSSASADAVSYTHLTLPTKA